VHKYVKTLIGTAAAAALGLVVLTTTAHYARAQAAAAPAAQAPAAKKTKQVKDTGEYDIFNEVVKDSDPAHPAPAKKFLADLDTWTQKYPNTDFKDRRTMFYIQAYGADNQLGKAMDTAKPLIDQGLAAMKEGLDEDSTVLQALFQTSRVAAALAAQGSGTPDQLATGQKASEMLSEFAKTFFAPEKKPANLTPDQWAQGLKQVEDLAKGTEFAIADTPFGSLKGNSNDPAACAAVEAQLKQAMEKYPDSGIIANQLASVDRCQQSKDPTKVQQALYYWARATVDPVGGVGQLDDKGQKTLDDYLKKVYTTIHGSADGLADLKALAAKSPNPPADFKIKTAAEVAAEQQKQFQDSHPQLALWLNIKSQLADTNGEQYFADSLKDHDMSGDNGSKLLKGTLVEAKPACRSKELLIAFPMPDATSVPAPELTIKLETALTGKPETGKEIEFNGVPTAFSKDPFMLTMTVDSAKEKIDGLTITPCAAPRGPAPRAPAPKKKDD